MNPQEHIDYNRISQAIEFIRQNFKAQPHLDEVASAVNLSPYHLQRLFTSWVGVSPKKFLQYLSLEYAKSLLKDQHATLFDAAFETGLSGTGRLHDLFINIEGMTPGEFKNGGENLAINYSYSTSPFGSILIASTGKGICHMAFFTEKEKAQAALQSDFPNARYNKTSDRHQQNALRIFTDDWKDLPRIKLHLKGTDFQLKVWQTLLKIPMGKLSTYGHIAGKIDHPKASRAVGTAIGSNPVAFLIPCHRVIQSGGDLGGYRWETSRKAAIIGWEAAKTDAYL